MALFTYLAVVNESVACHHLLIKAVVATLAVLSVIGLVGAVNHEKFAPLNNA